MEIPSAESPPVTDYREQLASAKRAFAAEPRDREWAPQAEGQLRAAIESARAERPAPGTAGRDLQVECRSQHCRLSVPIPPGLGVASLPVVAEMAETLQRAHGAIAALGRIVGENAEPSDPSQRRRYALYLRREPAPPVVEHE